MPRLVEPLDFPFRLDIKKLIIPYPFKVEDWQVAKPSPEYGQAVQPSPEELRKRDPLKEEYWQAVQPSPEYGQVVQPSPKELRNFINSHRKIDKTREIENFVSFYLSDEYKEAAAAPAAEAGSEVAEYGSENTSEAGSEAEGRLESIGFKNSDDFKNDQNFLECFELYCELDSETMRVCDHTKSSSIKLINIIDRILKKDEFKENYSNEIGFTVSFVNKISDVSKQLKKLRENLNTTLYFNHDLKEEIKKVMTYVVTLAKQKQWSFGEYWEQVFACATPNSRRNILIASNKGFKTKLAPSYEVDIDFYNNKIGLHPVEITSLCSNLDHESFKEAFQERLKQKDAQLDAHQQQDDFKEKYGENKEQLLIVVNSEDQRNWAYEIIENLVKGDNKIEFDMPFRNKIIPLTNDLNYFFTVESRFENCCVIITKEELKENLNVDYRNYIKKKRRGGHRVLKAISPKGTKKQEAAKAAAEQAAAEQAAAEQAAAESQAAATKIQAVFRGHKGRKVAESQAAATKIQAVIRGYKGRKAVAKSQAAAIKIQAVIRGHKGRKAAPQQILEIVKQKIVKLQLDVLILENNKEVKKLKARQEELKTRQEEVSLQIADRLKKAEAKAKAAEDNLKKVEEKVEKENELLKNILILKTVEKDLQQKKKSLAEAEEKIKTLEEAIVAVERIKDYQKVKQLEQELEQKLQRAKVYAKQVKKEEDEKLTEASTEVQSAKKELEEKSAHATVYVNEAEKKLERAKKYETQVTAERSKKLTDALTEVQSVNKDLSKIKLYYYQPPLRLKTLLDEEIKIKNSIKKGIEQTKCDRCGRIKADYQTYEQYGLSIRYPVYFGASLYEILVQIDSLKHNEIFNSIKQKYLKDIGDIELSLDDEEKKVVFVAAKQKSKFDSLHNMWATISPLERFTILDEFQSKDPCQFWKLRKIHDSVIAGDNNKHIKHEISEITEFSKNIIYKIYQELSIKILETKIQETKEEITAIVQFKSALKEVNTFIEESENIKEEKEKNLKLLESEHIRVAGSIEKAEKLENTLKYLIKNKRVSESNQIKLKTQLTELQTQLTELQKLNTQLKEFIETNNSFIQEKEIGGHFDKLHKKIQEDIEFISEKEIECIQSKIKIMNYSLKIDEIILQYYQIIFTLKGPDKGIDLYECFKEELDSSKNTLNYVHKQFNLSQNEQLKIRLVHFEDINSQLNKCGDGIKNLPKLWSEKYQASKKSLSYKIIVN